MRDADVVCNCACPLCCKGGRSPQPASRNSSGASSCQGSTRPGARVFRAVHDHAYWDNLGLHHHYHTYDARLEVNGISPHQVLLERKIDDFSRKEAGDALAAVAVRFPDDSDVSAESDLDASA